MSIYFLLIGKCRNIKLLINHINNIFFEHKISINLLLSSDLLETEKNYINQKFDINTVIKKNNVDTISFVNDDMYEKNHLKYLYKLSISQKYLKSGFDYYILTRTDIVFNDIKFLEYIENDSIYFSSKINNTNIDTTNSINDHIIITKNIEKLELLKYIYSSNYQFNEKLLYDYLTENRITYQLIDINYKLILSYCNIIAISGDSGSGKSTLLHELQAILGNKNTLKLETDRYHKWERGDEQYKKFTHLNPYANHLEKMTNDVFDLKIGNNIYSVDYDHSTGKFTQIEKIESTPCVVLCGLHTLYVNKINEILNIKIFMDTDRELIKKWKIKRDIDERGYSMEKIIKQINERESDYILYINNQKNNADIIINFYEVNDELKCKMKISNNIYMILSLYLIRMKYDVNTELEFELQNINCEDKIGEFINNKKIELCICHKNNYYSEIQLFFLNLIYN